MNRMVLGILCCFTAPLFLFSHPPDSPPEVLERITQKVRTEVTAWFWDPSVDMTGTLSVDGRRRVRGKSLPQPFVFRMSFAYRCTGEIMLRFGDERESLVFYLQRNKISVYDFKEEVYTFLKEETLGEVLPLLLKDLLTSKLHPGGNGFLEKLEKVFPAEGVVSVDDEKAVVHVRSRRRVREPRSKVDYLQTVCVEICRKSWLPLRVEMLSGKSATRDMLFEMQCDAMGYPREFKLEKRESWRKKHLSGKTTFDPVGRLTGMNMEVSNPPVGDCTLILELDRNRGISNEFTPPPGFSLVDFDSMIQRLSLDLDHFEFLTMIGEWME